MITPSKRSAGTTVYILLLLICCLVTYWPLTLGLYSLKNDALNYFLPVRHLISESITSGHWPFWSPYFNLGYPLHGDMQSGVWNPIVQIFSLFGTYTLRTLQWETLLYVYLSGVGMFFLTKHFIADLKICFLAAVSFMLCGFNSDSAQFLNWISAASFLPFCLLFYYRTITEAKWKPAFLFAIFFFLLFVTSYPADFILSVYLFAAMLIWHLVQKENRKRKTVIIQIKFHLLIALLFIALALPAIISYAEFLPLSERGSGASYNDVMSNPFHPLLMFSYLTPLPVWKANFATITDPLERNSYFGVISFAFLLLSFFIKSEIRITRFLKWAFIISLVFSFGEFGLIRIISYYILPLMNSFRHPANAKLFTILFGCLLAAFALKELANRDLMKSRHSVYLLLLLFFSSLFVWSFFGPITIQNITGHMQQGFKNLLDTLTFSDLLLINILLQVPFLICLYFFFVKKVNVHALVIVAAINSIIHTALVQPFTVVKKDSVTAIQNVLNEVQVNGYPIPDLHATLAENSIDGNKYFDEIGVSNLYNKKIGRVDYRISPSNLLHQNEFWFNEKIRNQLFTYPIFYKADTLIQINDSASLPLINKRVAIVEANDIKQTPAISSAYDVSVQKFSPNKIELVIQSDAENFYTLFQNYYPRWKLKINEQYHDIHKTNVSFMGFIVPAGKNNVSLTYAATDLKIAFFISLLALISMLASVFFIRDPRSN